MLNLKNYIRDIPNFPKEGIVFKDLTPLWQDKSSFRNSIQLLKERYEKQNIDLIVAAEARGFIVGASLAYAMNTGFVPVRKPGKLPYKTISASYQLEYGTDTLTMHEDAIKEGQNILIVDDLLATGGTAKAMTKMVELLKGKVIEIAFLVELTFLNGREKLKDYNLFSLIQY
ncbi:adenine phosphoribosyltransferase [bacterium]|nr:adenine phosphoribosyltransferase [bacterium]MBU0899485.1 adenine phosphoribosyltransferase [bacterium]MBU1153939.1 adenine phosphoribosyltransferase [bacterium]MBU1782903.1 adenine phosphoribosyltransferase [bacterium]